MHSLRRSLALARAGTARVGDPRTAKDAKESRALPCEISKFEVLSYD